MGEEYDLDDEDDSDEYQDQDEDEVKFERPLVTIDEEPEVDEAMTEVPTFTKNQPAAATTSKAQLLAATAATETEKGKNDRILNKKIRKKKIEDKKIKKQLTAEEEAAIMSQINDDAEKLPKKMKAMTIAEEDDDMEMDEA